MVIQRRRRRRSIIRDFFLNTSAHGLPGIARSETIKNRLFWIISFVMFTGAMIYYAASAIVAYFTYSTNIDLSMVSEWPQYFPAVSFCNVSPMRLDKFMGPYANFLNLPNTTIMNSSVLNEFKIELISNAAIANLNQNKSMEEYYFSLASMLQHCTYNSRACANTDFTSFVSSSYGLCHTFNVKLKGQSNRNGVRLANQYGGDGSLELDFYIHRHQYVPDIYNAFGIVILVHDNTEVPLVEKAGIFLAPGGKHKLSFRKQTSFFLPPPYSTCTNIISPMMQAMFDNYGDGDYKYSQLVCNQICGQVYAYEQCGCVSPFLWSARTIPKPGTNELFLAPLCNSTDACYRTSIGILWSSKELMAKYCSDCSPQCSLTSFTVQVSTLAAPPEWQLPSIKAFAENSSVPLPGDWTTKWSSHILNNYVSVNIIRETDLVENYTELATLGIVDVISNIGGQTGLWIGISFLSIMEIAEVLYRILRNEIYRIQDHEQKRTES